jgi:urease accessory protein
MNPMSSKFFKPLILLACASAATLASAHTGVEGHSQTSFLSGFVHPLLGLDHLGAMLAVGLWSALTARRGGRELLWGPLAFANMLLIGAVLGLRGVAFPAVEPMIATSLLVLGLLVVSRRRLPGVAAAALVGLFALFHGLSHGYELANNVNAFQTLAGMVSATLLLHAIGLALGWALRSAQAWLPRLIGGAIAAAGSALLLLQLS